MKEKRNTILKKTVCFIRSNPVRPDSRVEKEAWTLKEAGYDVHILAWDRDTDLYETEDLVCVAGNPIPITRLGHKASFGEGFKNIRAYLEFQFHMREWLKNHPFDIVHACDFDTAFFSLGVAKHRKQKFVFDIFDFIHGEPKNILQYCVKRAQIYIINHADATIICTEERRKQIKGSKPRRLTVIHNTPAIAQTKTSEETENDFSKVKIAYVGILQDYRLLKEIAEAVAESNNMELHIGGFGKYEEHFIQYSRKHDNIKYYGRLAYEDTLELEKKCDIMLAVYDPTIENHRFAAPNKFYESLMLGKPVVMVEGTGMAQVVSDNDIGVTIEYSKEGFIKGMNCLIKRQHQWSEMSQKMQKLYWEKYSWDEMKNRLLALYEQL